MAAVQFDFRTAQKLSGKHLHVFWVPCGKIKWWLIKGNIEAYIAGCCNSRMTIQMFSNGYRHCIGPVMPTQKRHNIIARIGDSNNRRFYMFVIKGRGETTYQNCAGANAEYLSIRDIEFL